MSKIRLHGSSSGHTEVAPAAAAGNNTVTLPNSAGTLLLTDGSAASLTQIPAANIVGVATAGFGNGILQVVQTVKTDTFSFTSSAVGNVSGGVSGDAIAASLTCSSTSNKVLIRAVLNVAHSNDNRIAAVLCADGSQISASLGDAGGNRSRVSVAGQLGEGGAQLITLNHEYLHSPSSTSSITYSYRLVNLDSTASRTLYLNMSRGDVDQAHYPRTQSILTLEEIAA